jgi:hypothetical protein
MFCLPDYKVRIRHCYTDRSAFLSSGPQSLANAVIVLTGTTSSHFSGNRQTRSRAASSADSPQKLKLLFLRTRLRRSHTCHTVVDTQLAVNFARMFD